MNSYDFIGCARRMGAVLIGRTEPSVLKVQEVATEIVRNVTPTLREMWNETVHEEVPERFRHLLASMPEDGPSNGSGHAPH